MRYARHACRQVLSFLFAALVSSYNSQLLRQSSFSGGMGVFDYLGGRLHATGLPFLIV